MFQISEVLKKVPFFRALGKEGIDFIIERLKFKPFEKDKVICKIGDPGDKMYIVISGKVKVVVYSEKSKEETIIAHLGSGDYFGEMSLLTGEPRSASVITVEPSEMFILNKTDFEVIVERFPSITLSMGKIMSQRLRDTLQKAAGKESGKEALALKGSLADKKLVDILKFCEANSLNGKLIVTSGNQKGTINYKRGELQNVETGDLKDDQAIDAMLNWNEGEFVIEPEQLKLDSEQAKSEKTREEPTQLLIINTSVVVQKMLQRTFENIGYDVYAVETKEKGINLIKKLEPDLVVADIKLPDCDGFELTKSIREVTEIPIVLLTEERNRDSYMNNLSDVKSIGFTKSHEISEILHTVEQLIGR